MLPTRRDGATASGHFVARASFCVAPRAFARLAYVSKMAAMALAGGIALHARAGAPSPARRGRMKMTTTTTSAKLGGAPRPRKPAVAGARTTRDARAVRRRTPREPIARARSSPDARRRRGATRARSSRARPRARPRRRRSTAFARARIVFIFSSYRFPTRDRGALPIDALVPRPRTHAFRVSPDPSVVSIAQARAYRRARRSAATAAR